MIDYPFIPIPRAFFDSEKPYYQLPVEAKITLSKLMQLHKTAMWYDPPQVDDKGDVYVTFALSQVQSLVGCKEDKAAKILKQLSDQGCIRRKHQGQGKPDRIYINSLDLGTVKRDNRPTPLKMIDPAECRKQLESQIDFEELVSEFGFELVDDIVKIIVNALQAKNSVVTVGGSDYDVRYYQDRLLSVKKENIRYAICRLKSLQTALYAPSAYILSRLWESFDCAALYKQAGALPAPSKAPNVVPSGELGQAELEAIHKVLMG